MIEIIRRIFQRAWVWKWYTVSLMVAFTSSALFTWAVFQTNLVFLSVTTLSLQEFQGDGVVDRRLNIYYRFIRRRECEVSQNRWIWQWRDRNGRKIRFIVPVDMAMVPISDAGSGEPNEMIVSYSMPLGIEPGDWFFVSKTMEFCGVFSHIIGPTFRRTPDIPVHIELTDHGQTGIKIQSPLQNTPGNSP